MAKNYSRRDFIKSTLLGSGAFFISISPLKSFAQSTKKANTASIDATALNAQAKLLFYKKQYAEAAAIYQQLIAAYPDRISYYDGYARVLGGQQKTLAVAELYREGLKNNPDKPLFMHRLSLRIQDLCTGNRKAEIAYISQYGQSNLFEVAPGLMFEAISINNKKKINKGLYLNLRDIPRAVVKQNKAMTRKHLPIVNFPESMQNDIKSTSADYEQTWAWSRSKHKPFMSDQVETIVDKINKEVRRELYTLKEKTLRDSALKKTRKEHWKYAFEKNLKEKNTNKVEKYGMLVLAEQITDTDTIGKLRKHYKKSKTTDRLISLNRYLYLNNENVPNTLVLADSLIKYGNSGSALSEADTLLDKVSDYVNTLPPQGIVCYFLARAEQKIKNVNTTGAQAFLLEGLRKFDGRGGTSYAMMEKYATTYADSGLTKAENIQKALCGKTVDPIDDPVWIFVSNFLEDLKANGKVCSTMEQVKQYTALAKIQKKTGSAEYGFTMATLAELKGKLKKS